MTQEPCASTNIDCIDSEIQALIDSFMSAVAVAPDLEDAESVERREIDLRDRVGALAAKVLERDIQAAIDSEKIREAERELIKGWPKKLKNRGEREVVLEMSWGIAITVQARLCIPTKMTGDSGERDRLQGGGDAGRYFLHQMVAMGQVFAVFFAWILLRVEAGGRCEAIGRVWHQRGSLRR